MLIVSNDSSNRRRSDLSSHTNTTTNSNCSLESTKSLNSGLDVDDVLLSNRETKYTYADSKSYRRATGTSAYRNPKMFVQRSSIWNSYDRSTLQSVNRTLPSDNFISAESIKKNSSCVHFGSVVKLVLVLFGGLLISYCGRGFSATNGGGQLLADKYDFTIDEKSELPGLLVPSNYSLKCACKCECESVEANRNSGLTSETVNGGVIVDTIQYVHLYYSFGNCSAAEARTFEEGSVAVVDSQPRRNARRVLCIRVKYSPVNDFFPSLLNLFGVANATTLFSYCVPAPGRASSPLTVHP